MRKEIIISSMPNSDQMNMMDDMMQRMQTDPELEEAMMEHMAKMKSSRDSMMEDMMEMTP